MTLRRKEIYNLKPGDKLILDWAENFPVFGGTIGKELTLINKSSGEVSYINNDNLLAYKKINIYFKGLRLFIEGEKATAVEEEVYVYKRKSLLKWRPE